jgi:DNA-directed RNA polymerase specialized sigma24 family protein
MEKQVEDMPHLQDRHEASWNELRPLLDQELHRLPDKYRLAVVLCDLEGRSRKEVAGQLAIPEGTLSSRLAMGRLWETISRATTRSTR